MNAKKLIFVDNTTELLAEYNKRNSRWYYCLALQNKEGDFHYIAVTAYRFDELWKVAEFTGVKVQIQPTDPTPEGYVRKEYDYIEKVVS